MKVDLYRFRWRGRTSVICIQGDHPDVELLIRLPILCCQVFEFGDGKIQGSNLAHFFQRRTNHRRCVGAGDRSPWDFGQNAGRILPALARVHRFAIDKRRLLISKRCEPT